jgi:acetylornithine/N-succinyldiaminopimelate aminotransferase
VNGTRYLDFIAGIGVNALGHAHPRIVKVIREQAALLIHSSNLYYHQYQGPLAKKLAETSGLQRTFFTNSGTEAMEGALKMIRSHGNHSGAGKHEIISLENSFHGRTLGALSITGQAKYRQDFEPLLPGVRFVPANDVEALEAAFSESTAGMVLELIQGEGGIYPISPEYAAEGARAGRPLQRPAGVRRDPMRRGPAGHVFRLSAQQAGGAAGYHGGGQTAGLRPAAGRHRG